MGFHRPTGKDFKIEPYFRTWGGIGLTIWVKLYQLKTFRLFFLIPIHYWKLVSYETKYEYKDYWEKNKAIKYIKTMPSTKWDKMQLDWFTS